MFSLAAPRRVQSCRWRSRAVYRAGSDWQTTAKTLPRTVSRLTRESVSPQTDHFTRQIQTLESSLTLLRSAKAGSIDYEIYRNAVVKGFELTLETSGKLLRKSLKAYTGGPRSVDELSRAFLVHSLTDRRNPHLNLVS